MGAIDEKKGIKNLENELTGISDDVVLEEQGFANSNYGMLNEIYNDAENNLPYPNVNPFDVTNDTDFRVTLQYQKRLNSRFWDKMDQVSPYIKKGELYIGHLRDGSQTDYFFVDNYTLETQFFNHEGKTFRLINVNDRNYAELLNQWRYPDKYNLYSRNIIMKEKIVLDVDVVYDSRDKLYSEITDAYLRRALLRSKKVDKLQSIIQTIQEKQNAIRVLSKDNSFILQGCAGSGKTMVLLHRLKYLLYNKDISSANYMFLAPSKYFVNFLEDILSDFYVNKSNVLTVFDYFKNVFGSSEETKENNKNEANKVKFEITEKNELNFDENYLQFVYSEDFIKESYFGSFDNVEKKLNELIDLCEVKLREIVENEKQEIVAKLQALAVIQANKDTRNIEENIEIRIKQFSDIKVFLEKVENEYFKTKTEYEKYIQENGEDATFNDEQIANNSELIKLREGIEQEKKKLADAFIFTKFAHKAKLKSLQKNYDRVKQSVIKKIEEEHLRNILRYRLVFGKFELSDIEVIINKIKKILDNTEKEIKRNLENFNDNMQSKFLSKIDILNQCIELSSNMDKNILVKELMPYDDLLNKVDDLYEQFKDDFKSETEKNKFEKFSRKRLRANLATHMLNLMKKSINAKFGIKISKVYKHYWYLRAYCRYLFRYDREFFYQYIFIDEVQDLSVSELHFIKKINSDSNKPPVINMFGDICQRISSHSIEKWELISDISFKVYFLSENFRNTNQITEYCNSHLPNIRMEQISIDLDKVSEYDTLDQINFENKDELIFIVKNECWKKSIEKSIGKKKTKNCKCYTIKDVKGLEFREVFVFDSNMSENEKYIAYTRALVKLNVIKSLPDFVECASLIIDGEDDDEED